jgi:hypothetical protein
MQDRMGHGAYVSPELRVPGTAADDHECRVP